MRHLAVLAVLVAGFGCALGNSTPSLVQVISDPKNFSGQEVSVFGYLGGLNLHLFLTRDHERMRDYSSAISVVNLDFHETAISEYCHGYAMVEGRVVKGTDTPLIHVNQVQLYELNDLRRIFIFPDDGPMYECWPGKSKQARP